jgi:hypothetical protein
MLSVSFELKEKRLLWLIPFTRTEYFLQVGKQFDLSDASWLEKQILHRIGRKTRQEYRPLLSELISSFVDSLKGWVLSRSIIAAVAENAKSTFIHTSLTRKFLSRTITIEVSESDKMDDFYQTCEEISRESNENNEFWQFGQAIRKFIGSTIHNQQNQD